VGGAAPKDLRRGTAWRPDLPGREQTEIHSVVVVDNNNNTTKCSFRKGVLDSMTPVQTEQWRSFVHVTMALD
jgi:hypothetical protein